MKNLLNMIILFSFPFAFTSTAFSHTWHIKPNATGDAPTIQAGIDSAMAGDTVLVDEGEYPIYEDIIMKNGVVLTSVSGPHFTRLISGEGATPSWGIYCKDLDDTRTEVSGFWIEGFKWFSLGSGIVTDNVKGQIRENILVDNANGILSFNSGVLIENNTTHGNTYYGIRGTSGGELYNNIFWDRASGMDSFWFAMCNDFMNLEDAGLHGLNFQGEPEFCGIYGSGNYYLQSDSPCAPGNDPLGGTCGLIGALPLNCGTVEAKKMSWGAIKELFD